MHDGRLQVAANDTRHGDVDHVGVFLVLRADDAAHLAAEVRQLDEHPEGDDQPEADAHDDVAQRRACVDDARGARRCKALQPRAERLQRVRQPFANFLALQHVAVLAVELGSPRLEVVDDGGQAVHEVDELVADAEHRREDDEQQKPDHNDEQNEREHRADGSIDAVLVEPVDGAAQDEHEHDRPHDRADGVRNDAREVHDGR